MKKNAAACHFFFCVDNVHGFFSCIHTFIGFQTAGNLLTCGSAVLGGDPPHSSK
jgi:hypothetical protein